VYEVPENIHTHLKGGCGKFKGGGRPQRPKCLKESNDKPRISRGM